MMPKMNYQEDSENIQSLVFKNLKPLMRKKIYSSSDLLQLFSSTEESQHHRSLQRCNTPRGTAQHTYCLPSRGWKIKWHAHVSSKSKQSKEEWQVFEQAMDHHQIHKMQSF